MIKVGILGAGISGLSMARLLGEGFETEVLEKNALPGGIARTKDIGGIPYHLVGGHCFNSKYPEVMDFVFNKILPACEWKKVERKSAIRLHGYEVNYPIEFSIKQIYGYDKELALKMVADFLNSQDDTDYANLEDWFVKKFGKTLAEEYFIPYNTKIWNNDLTKMSHLWVEDKLPVPNRYDFFDNLTQIAAARDKMPHTKFYYPASNNQNTFIDALAQGLNIRYNYSVTEIDSDKKTGQWIVNNELTYDILISTLPLKEIPILLKNTPDSVKTAGEKLKYNKISNVLWKNRPCDKTWTYIPEKDRLFHRYIHIGNYINPQQDYSISEAVGVHTFEDMMRSGAKDPFLTEAIDHHISDYAYVVFDENYQESTRIIKEYLNDIRFHTLGRFGEWQYYNMDVCIKRAMDLNLFF